MEKIKACKLCRKLFTNIYIDSDICPECSKKESEKFERVKDYVWDHKGCSIYVVSKECDVEVDLIKRWLKEERLSVVPDETGNEIPPLECERCGVLLWRGRFCLDCLTKQKEELKQAAKELEAGIEKKKIGTVIKQTSGDARMRYIGK